MKEEFREFYYKEEIDFTKLDDSILVVLDTNVLLHIFRFSIESRRKLMKSVKKVENNLWLPYHVGLEYNLHKVALVNKMRKSKENIQQEIDQEVEVLKNSVFRILDNIGIKSIDEKVIRKAIKDNFDKKTNELMTEWKRADLSKEFALIGNVVDESDKMGDIFRGKVGKQFTQDEIDEIERDGEKRYALNFPPGYKDGNNNKKELRKYGNVTYHEKYSDLIIWKQIIDRAKDEKIKKVVFVTDDEKEDWQYIFEGEKKGPRAELKKELLDEANADLFLFNTNSFLKLVNDNSVDIIDLEMPFESRIKATDDIYKKQLNESNFFRSKTDDTFYKLNNDVYNVNGADYGSSESLKNNFENEYLMLKNKKINLISDIDNLKRKYSRLLRSIRSINPKEVSGITSIELNNLLNKARDNRNKLNEADADLRRGYINSEVMLSALEYKVFNIREEYYSLYNKLIDYTV